MAYSYWYNTDYEPGIQGSAYAIPGFWGIDSSNPFAQLAVYEDPTLDWERPHGMLTNGVVMDKLAEMCQLALKELKLDLAGRHGATDVQNMYYIMCGQYCLMSDEMHVRAMAVSKCNCVELSTFQSGESPVKVIGSELQYHTAGDFCKRNSARMLCNIHEECGVWECELSDFMCPRHEWAHGTSMVRGMKLPNICSRAARGASTPHVWVTALVALLAMGFAVVAADGR